MKLLVDIQSLQTVGSSKRGIGRYSLNILYRLAATNRNNEIIFLANKTLGIPEDIIQKLNAIGSTSKILEWASPLNSMYLTAAEDFRSICKEIYKEVILQINPDIHLILSPFEGLGDDVIWSTVSSIPSVSIFYDAIPAIFEKEYLAEKPVRSWYKSILDSLGNVDGLISISESSKQDAEKVLCLKPKRHICVNAGLDEGSIALAKSALIDNSLDFGNKYIFSVLGEDFRKNKLNLVYAFKELVSDSSFRHNLLIAYKQSPHERNANSKLIQDLGLTSRLKFLDYIPDDALFSYYKNADLFVFPSLYEGLGLPILEAQACEVPVIGSNTSSMQELFQSKDFLFDPTDSSDIAKVIKNLLSNNELREANILEGQAFVLDHSSIQVGEQMWKFFSELVESNLKEQPLVNDRVRLAFFTPLPPQKSGIATHGSEIIALLQDNFELTVFADEFRPTSELDTLDKPYSILSNDKFRREDFDVMLYNIGNSQFHIEAAEILKNNPGIIILHDTFLSGLAWIKLVKSNTTSNFPSVLYEFGGITALSSFLLGDEHEKILDKHMLNSFVVERATSVIVHSSYAKDLISRDFDCRSIREIEIIPQQHHPINEIQNSVIFPKNSFVFATFGAIANTKMYRELLEAWKGSKPQLAGNAQLYFVGEDLTYDIHRIIDELDLRNSVKITGYLQASEFQSHLNQVDVGIQLRNSSRGETSRALLDLFAAGKPVIINENGSFAEFESYGVLRLQDKFAISDLRYYIDEIYEDSEMRHSLGILNIEKLKTLHVPYKYVEKLTEVISDTTTQTLYNPENVSRRLVKLAREAQLEFSQNEIERISKSVGQSFRHSLVKRRAYIDVTDFLDLPLSDGERNRIKTLIGNFAIEFYFIDVRFVIRMGANLDYVDDPSFIFRFFTDIAINLPVTEIDTADLAIGFWPLKSEEDYLYQRNLVEALELAFTRIKTQFDND